MDLVLFLWFRHVDEEAQLLLTDYRDSKAGDDYYQEELEAPRAEAMMEVEFLEKEEEIGPSLGRVLSLNANPYNSKSLILIIIQPSCPSLSSPSTAWGWASSFTRSGEVNTWRRSQSF